jgi:hypothetical protein
MKVLLVVLLNVLLCITVAQAQAPSPNAGANAAAPQSAIDPAKEADIRHLLEVTKAGVLATQAMDAQEKVIRPMLVQAFPPGDYRDKLIDLFFAKFHAKRNIQDLENLIVPVYDKYYTREEIQQLLKIYETPLGQKMVDTMPKILQESQEAGRTWGESMGRDSMREVLAEHPEFQKAIEDAKRGQQP